MERAGDRAGDVERRAAELSERLGRYKRYDEKDKSDHDPGDDRQEAKE
jgi:hypothetical protein